MPRKTQTERTSSESFANRMAKSGYTDFYVIDRENARRLLTEKRLEIIESLRNEEVDSMRDLARKLDRDIKQISEDLDVLYQMSIIDYRKKGNRKIPELKHQTIFIEPI